MARLWPARTNSIIDDSLFVETCEFYLGYLQTTICLLQARLLGLVSQEVILITDTDTSALTLEPKKDGPRHSVEVNVLTSC